MTNAWQLVCDRWQCVDHTPQLTGRWEELGWRQWRYECQHSKLWYLGVGKHVAEEKIKTEGHNMYEAFLIKNKRWFLDKRAAYFSIGKVYLIMWPLWVFIFIFFPTNCDGLISGLHRMWNWSSSFFFTSKFLCLSWQILLALTSNEQPKSQQEYIFLKNSKKGVVNSLGNWKLWILNSRFTCR